MPIVTAADDMMTSSSGRRQPERRLSAWLGQLNRKAVIDGPWEMSGLSSCSPDADRGCWCSEIELTGSSPSVSGDAIPSYGRDVSYTIAVPAPGQNPETINLRAVVSSSFSDGKKVETQGPVSAGGKFGREDSDTTGTTQVIRVEIKKTESCL